MRVALRSRPSVVVAGAIALIAIVIIVLGSTILLATATKTSATLAFTTKVDGRLVTIDGSSDLPNGAVISWEVAHERTLRDIDASRHDPSVPDLITGGTALTDGHFQANVDLTQWPPGTVEVIVEFRPSAGQPSAIVAVFGEGGERLDGPDVQVDSGNERRLSVWSEFVLS